MPRLLGKVAIVTGCSGSSAYPFSIKDGLARSPPGLGTEPSRQYDKPTFVYADVGAGNACRIRMMSCASDMPHVSHIHHNYVKILMLAPL